MNRTTLIFLCCLVAFSALVHLFAGGRDREVDATGNAMLRYTASPYVLAVCALALIGVGTQAWFVPANHKHFDTLLTLCYIPWVCGVCAAVQTAYLLTFRATLCNAVIRVSRWPLGTRTWALDGLDGMESKGTRTVLHFAGGGRFVIHNACSGHAYFLEALHANMLPKAMRRKPRVA